MRTRLWTYDDLPYTHRERFVPIFTDPLLDRINDLTAQVKKWRQLYDVEQEARLRLGEALGTLVMFFHVRTITRKVWEDFKSIGDVMIDPRTGDYNLVVVPQGPVACKKVYGG